jgi:hypothetical protein
VQIQQGMGLCKTCLRISLSVPESTNSVDKDFKQVLLLLRKKKRFTIYLDFNNFFISAETYHKKVVNAQSVVFVTNMPTFLTFRADLSYRMA